MNTGELARTNERLRGELALAKAKAANTPLLLKLLVGSFFLNIVTCTVVFGFYPKTRTIETTNAASVCEVRPLDEAWVSYATVNDFAARAVVATYSFSYTNWKEALLGTADRYYTDGFRKKYVPAFASSDTRKLVESQFLNVTSITDGPPDLNFEGTDALKRHYWDVDVPIQVTYHAGSDKPTNTIVLAHVRVVRNIPTRFNPDPVAIDNIAVAQRLH